MSRHSSRELSWVEPWLLGASILVLAVCITYGVAGLHLPKTVPWQSADWKVAVGHPQCGQEICLQAGDQVTSVGGVTLEEFTSSPSVTIFPASGRDKTVDVAFVRGDRLLHTSFDWHQEPFALEIEAIFMAVLPMVLWVLGTLTVVFVRPRDVRRLILTAFYYVTSVFVAAGLISALHQLYSVYLVHVAVALLLPLSVHLHLILPSRAFPRITRFLVPTLWLVAIVFLAIDVMRGFPAHPMRALLAATLVLSAVLFGARFLRKAPGQVRAAEKLMLAGWCLGILPLLLIIAMQSLGLYPELGEPVEQLLNTVLVLVFLPLWPTSYLWAIYRADLGRIEVRANRALGGYGFWCIYLAAYVSCFLILTSLSAWFGNNTLLAGLLVSVCFVACAPWLRSRFQTWIDRRLFGIHVAAERLPLEFASRIPAAFERYELRRILVEEILPSLLIRQSALLLFEGEDIEPLYSQSLDDDQVPGSRNAIDELLATAGRPRKAPRDDRSELRWIRLVLPLQSRTDQIGVWLLGRRDPEDAYPRSDIEVLRSLANQITAVVRAKTEIERRRRLQDQLIQSQKMEAIGRLSAGVAHDFNNLLSAILGYSDLLLTGKPEALGAQRKFVEGIKEAGDKAASLTAQLLAFSRQQVMTARVVDLNEVVVQLENLLRRVIEEDIELSTEFHRKELFVRIDPGQMEQVLLNLVVNACDAMGDGGRLMIATGLATSSESAPCHPDVPPGEYVTLSVTDDGTGIDPEVRDRIFEPFFTTKVPGQGTGLGLAMVYGIVNQSRGHITVDSAQGLGTTFSLYLPLAHSEPVPDPLPATERLAASGPETILLVEDEQSVRRVVREILRSRGYTVLSAEDGKTALEMAEHYDGAIDLLLTDVMMPHVKGPDLADHLYERRPGIKVVFMSGYNEEEVLGERLRTGDTVLIRKPFSPEQLAQQIRKALDGELASSSAA
ncbi:MAG: response regulator [Thermoanaerobaculia bacterium]|nr:response regulator [Thermoanaerobaculia bacterium]